MNRLSRSQALKIAAGILLVMSLLDLVGFQMPALMAGQTATNQIADTGNGPPFFIVLLLSALDVLAVVVAYGLWRGQRWGVILCIIISAFGTLNGLGATLFAGDMGLRVLAGVGTLLSLATIALCLWRERKPQGRTLPV